MRILVVISLVFIVGCTGTSPVTSVAQPPYQAQRMTSSEFASSAAYAIAYEVLAQALSSPEKVNLIWGACRVKTDDRSNIYLPCNNVEIVLLNDDGKEISTTRTDGGRFTFHAERAVRYRLKLKSKNYRLPNDHIGPFQGGNSITIELKQLPKAS